MAIYETATKLANEIKSSKEYTQFKKYMQEVKKDPESEKLLTEYKMTQVKVQNFTVNDQKDQKRNLAKFESLKKKLSRYLNSEQQFTSMMAHINQILSQAVENDYK